MVKKKVVKSTKIDELFSVKDKVVLITGAGGLGGYLAKGFLNNGSKVILFNRTMPKLTALKEKLEKQDFTDYALYQVDQTDKTSLQKAADEAEKQFGRIDVLINTAAVCWNEDTEDFSEDGIRKMLDINVTGSMLVTQVIGKKMIEAGNGGSIIEIGSIGGLMCHSFRSMPYEASKAAVHQMTKSFATAWAQYGINVNCIAPTWIDTPMVDFAAGEVMDAVIDQHFFGRIAEVEDFLGAAIFLASDAANYVSGHILAVDGAWSVSKPWKVKGLTP